MVALYLVLQYFGGQGLRFEDKDRGPRVDEHKHPIF